LPTGARYSGFPTGIQAPTGGKLRSGACPAGDGDSSPLRSGLQLRAFADAGKALENLQARFTRLAEALGFEASTGGDPRGACTYLINPDDRHEGDGWGTGGRLQLKQRRKNRPRKEVENRII
jgi:hypothetical protein